MEAQFCVAIPETGRRGCSQITSNDLSLFISILSIYIQVIIPRTISFLFDFVVFN